MVKFVLRMVSGALFVGAAGFAADALLAVEGWWAWGICAGAIAGALATYEGEQVETRG